MKLLRFSFLFAILICLGFSSNSPMDRFVLLLEEMETSFAPEKAYIHTDKPFYTSGETIWLKSYLINGITHKKTSKSNVLHIELINPQDSIVFKDKFYIDDKKFGTAGDIKIKKDWESGTYQLRAFTRYMLNNSTEYFFRKNIRIKKQNDLKTLDLNEINKVPELTISQNSNQKDSTFPKDLNIHFYPESGEIVPKIPNKFGIKATDNHGKGLYITGAIKEKGVNEILTMFRTFDFGLGMTSFTPKSGVIYIAEVSTKTGTLEFELPVAPDHNQNISIQSEDDHLNLKINSSTTSLLNHFIIGHLRGKVFFSKMISENKKNIEIQLQTTKISSGIAHFTLFTPNGNPVCERLTFIDNESNLNCSISVSKKIATKRERLNLNVNINSRNKKIKNANVSIAITQKNAIPLSTNENIKSWLLLNSDLRGQVANAAIFFDLKKPKAQRKHLLESLLLTHGWRRFTWDNALKDFYKNRQEQKPEKGIYIKGYTTPINQPHKAQFALTKIQFLEGNFYSSKKFTDKTGYFEYGPFVIYDSVKAVLNAEITDFKNSEKKKNVDIYLKEELITTKIDPTPKSQIDIDNNYYNNYIKIQEYIGQLEFTFNGVNQLKELIISGKKKIKINSIDDIVSKLSIYGEPSNRIVVDSLPGIDGLSIFDLIGRTPGVTLSGNYPDQILKIRGQSTFVASSDPLFLIDGVRVDRNFVSGINASEVSFVDVLKGNDAAIFGVEGANGVIAIYLIEPGLSKKQKAKGVLSFTANPFYKAKEFFSPDYFKDASNPKPDFRTTLYWNPDIDITIDKTQNNYFYTGDQTGKFQIEIQGITDDGELIYAVEEFEVY